MKKLLITIPMLIGAALCNAQWAPINSTTTETLNDVDFKDENYGVIVGNRETILLTVDGGISWNDINMGTVRGDIYNVKVHNTDTIFVSSYDQSTTTGIIFLTVDGGSTWMNINESFVLNHRIDLEKNADNGKLFASSDHLISSDMYSSTWDSLISGIAGTTSLDLIRFADSQVGHLSGNVSGMIAYSSTFYRTEDAGTTWYHGDYFSMPNSNAFTTMNFVNSDTAYIFTNQYAGWVPSSINELVRLTNFNLTIPFPGDTAYTYNSSIVNTAMPDYINDARFTNAQNGLALGNTGKIYKTIDGGVNWTVDYTDPCSTCPLYKMDFENGTGYAAGANGLLIKYQLATTINNNTLDPNSVNVYPNPNNGAFKVSVKEGSTAVGEIFNIVGEKIQQIEFQNATTIDLTAQSKGLYFIKVTIDGLSVTKKITVQ